MSLTTVGNLEVQHFIGKKYGKIILFEWKKPLLTKHKTLPIFGPHFVAICSTIFHANFYQWYVLNHPHMSANRCVSVVQLIERWICNLQFRVQSPLILYTKTYFFRSDLQIQRHIFFVHFSDNFTEYKVYWCRLRNNKYFQPMGELLYIWYSAKMVVLFPMSYFFCVHGGYTEIIRQYIGIYISSVAAWTNWTYVSRQNHRM